MNLRFVIPWLALAAALLQPGCRSTRPAGPPAVSPGARPAWIMRPKSDDSVYLYRVGQAAGHASPAAARRAAYQNALDVLAEELLTRVTVAAERSRLKPQLALSSVEIIPGCVYTEEHSGNHSCWVQVSYPLQEKDKLLRTIRSSGELNDAWSRSRASAARGDYRQARQVLEPLLAGAETARFLTFQTDEARLLMGDSARALNDPLEARRWYESILALSDDDTRRRQARERLSALPPAPRLWPLHERWHGARVGLVCALREGGACRRFNDLAAVLQNDCAQARLPSTDLGRRLDAAALGRLFDAGDAAAALSAAGEGDIGVLLGVLADIDPERRRRVKSGEGPALDTTVHVSVLDGRSGQLLYGTRFKEIAGAQSPPRLAQHIAGILIARYLAPHCPPLPRPPPPAPGPDAPEEE